MSKWEYLEFRIGQQEHFALVPKGKVDIQALVSELANQTISVKSEDKLFGDLLSVDRSVHKGDHGFAVYNRVYAFIMDYLGSNGWEAYGELYTDYKRRGETRLFKREI